MKIARLELRAFGPFTDVALDFDAGQHGLHVVYGANEAGKSSTLRALKQLLYGIPQRTNDDFVHPYANLRIGGVLRNGDGTRLECVRRKAARNDLRAADDNAPLEATALTKYLGGVDRETFEMMFGIDHAALVQGGRDIVEGKGSLGQILFAAGAGIADLKGVHAQLEKDAGELFKAGAKNPRINSKLSEWEAARKATAAAQLSTAEWERHDKLLRQSREELAEVERSLEAARTEKSRLERVSQAVALVAKLNELSARAAELGEVTLLPEGFSERRREAVTQLTAAESEIRVVRQALEELDSQMRQLAAPEPLLAQRHAIEPLSDALGSYRKAQHDLPGLVASRAQLMDEIAARLRHLRPDLPIDQIETLRLSRRQQVEIQNLGNRHEALVAGLRQAREQVASLTERMQAAQTRLAALEEPRDAEPLKSVLRRAQ
ncbi:MAG TPA: AAA family ATPase, partial [Pirellulales bacterium]